MKIWLELLTKRRAPFNIASLSVLVVLLVALVSTPAYADGDLSGYDASWTYDKATTIDHAKVQADLTDVPVLANLSSDTNLTDLANKGNDSENGNDDEAAEAADEAADEAAEAAAEAADEAAEAADEAAAEAAEAAEAADEAADEAAEAADEAAVDGDGDVEPSVTVSSGDGGYLCPLNALAMSINMQNTLTTTVISFSGELLKSLILTDADNNLTLEFDKGTKIAGANNQAPRRITLELGDSIPPPSDAVILGPIYEFNAYLNEHSSTPSQITISPSATMVMAYDPEELPENTSSVFIAYYDEEQGWIQLEPPTGFVAEVGETAAQVSHFSSFAVIAELVPPPPARFEVRNLAINPNQVRLGESVTISAQLVNIGGLSGEYHLMVNIEGLLTTSRVIGLAPGQNQEISFPVTPDSSGSYRVEVGSLQGNFVVEEIPSPLLPAAKSGGVAEAGGYTWLPAVILAVLAIVALAFTTGPKPLTKYNSAILKVKAFAKLYELQKKAREGS